MPYPSCKLQAPLHPGSVKEDLDDLVTNGSELASGSIRIRDPDLQNRVFRLVDFNPAEAEKRFGFLTTAFKFGDPLHGGFAPSLDRLVRLMAGEPPSRKSSPSPITPSR